MKYSKITYTYSGGDRIFSIPFEFLDKDYIHVFINSVELDKNKYELEQQSVIINENLNIDDLVSIVRITDSIKLVDFTGRNDLKSYDLNLALTQVLHVLQEEKDNIVEIMPQTPAGDWDADNKKLCNLAPAVEPSDAVRKDQIVKLAFEGLEELSEKIDENSTIIKNISTDTVTKKQLEELAKIFNDSKADKEEIPTLLTKFCINKGALNESGIADILRLKKIMFEPIIPDMTNYTTPEGVVTVIGGENAVSDQAWKAFAPYTPGIRGSGHCYLSAPNQAYPIYPTYTFSEIQTSGIYIFDGWTNVWSDFAGRGAFDIDIRLVKEDNTTVVVDTVYNTINDFDQYFRTKIINVDFNFKAVQYVCKSIFGNTSNHCSLAGCKGYKASENGSFDFDYYYNYTDFKTPFELTSIEGKRAIVETLERQKYNPKKFKPLIPINPNTYTVKDGTITGIGGEYAGCNYFKAFNKIGYQQNTSSWFSVINVACPCGVKYPILCTKGNYIFKCATGFWGDTNGYPATQITICLTKENGEVVEVWQKKDIANAFNQHFTSPVINIDFDFKEIYWRVDGRWGAYVSLGDCQIYKEDDEGSRYFDENYNVFVGLDGEIETLNNEILRQPFNPVQFPVFTSNTDYGFRASSTPIYNNVPPYDCFNGNMLGLAKAVENPYIMLEMPCFVKCKNFLFKNQTNPSSQLLMTGEVLIKDRSGEWRKLFNINVEDIQFETIIENPEPDTEFNGIRINPFTNNGDAAYITFSLSMIAPTITEWQNKKDTVWLNTSVEPLTVKKFDGKTWQSYTKIPLGSVGLRHGYIIVYDTFPFNQNGYIVNANTSITYSNNIVAKDITKSIPSNLITKDMFTTSLAGNGYCILPTGLILQWGYAIGWNWVNFPIVFPHALFNVQTTDITGESCVACPISDMSQAHFYIRNGTHGGRHEDRGGIANYWFAIGY